MSDTSGPDIEVTVGAVEITPHACAYDYCDCDWCRDTRDAGWTEAHEFEAEVVLLRSIVRKVRFVAVVSQDTACQYDLAGEADREELVEDKRMDALSDDERAALERALNEDTK